MRIRLKIINYSTGFGRYAGLLVDTTMISVQKTDKKTTRTVYMYFLSAADGKDGLHILDVDANTFNTKSMAAT